MYQISASAIIDIPKGISFEDTLFNFHVGNSLPTFNKNVIVYQNHIVLRFAQNIDDSLLHDYYIKDGMLIHNSNVKKGTHFRFTIIEENDLVETVKTRMDNEMATTTIKRLFKQPITFDDIVKNGIERDVFIKLCKEYNVGIYSDDLPIESNSLPDVMKINDNPLKEIDELFKEITSSVQWSLVNKQKIHRIKELLNKLILEKENE